MMSISSYAWAAFDQSELMQQRTNTQYGRSSARMLENAI